LFDAWPALAGKVPWAPLGDFPTPVDPLGPALRAAGVSRDDAWVKRDDLSSPVYGGNKVRTLEALFGKARAEGASHVYATGAFGSNHAAATGRHAPRADLRAGVILFPQPESATARENLAAILSARPEVIGIPMLALPFGMWRARRRHAARGEKAFVMVPGGATPEGALGYVSAGLELAHQIARGELPAPAAIVVGVGSTCTSAGLLVGLAAARKLGIVPGDSRVTRVVAVRVTPWPVTAKFRIVGLAVRTARLLARLTGDASLAFPRRALAEALDVDGRFLGPGYGEPTASGREAIAAFAAILALDTTYTGKTAAALLARARAGGEGPLLFWSTKPPAPLPPIDDDAIARAPARMRRFLVTSSN
jgi:D-cysteine desulfhydrase